MKPPTETRDVEIDEPPLEPDDEKDIVEGGRISPRIVFEILRRDGTEELERPVGSLVWSGIAAGIMISFSVLAEALLRTHLPDTPYRPLIENFGYSAGFVLTIMGRLQLFTENTITTVIPLLSRLTVRNFALVARLWLVVFGANVVGTLVAAAFMAHSGALAPELVGAIEALARHVVKNTPVEMFLRGVPAGILIAAIVWMLPSAGASALWIIILFTYLIALGDFTHIVAGMTEAGFLVLTGALGPIEALGGFVLPVFLGNVVGGTLVFTLLVYGQVHNEI